MFEVFLKLAEIEASFWAPLETSLNFHDRACNGFTRGAYFPSS